LGEKTLLFHITEATLSERQGAFEDARRQTSNVAALNHKVPKGGDESNEATELVTLRVRSSLLPFPTKRYQDSSAGIPTDKVYSRSEGEEFKPKRNIFHLSQF